MSNEIQKTEEEENEQIKKTEYSDVINRISSKSNNIKAMLKCKYLIYKLERSYYYNKFML